MSDTKEAKRTVIWLEDLGLRFDAHTPLTKQEYDTLRIMLRGTESEVAGFRVVLPCFDRELLNSVTQILTNRLLDSKLSEQERREKVLDLPMYEYNGVAEALLETYLEVDRKQTLNREERLN